MRPEPQKNAFTIVCRGHAEVETAIARLHSHGFDMKTISVIGRDIPPERQVVACYRIVGAFVIAMAVLGVLGVASYRTTQGLLDAEALVVHTHDVIDSLDNLSTDITAVESAARGFVLTGEQSYLADDSTARSEIEQDACKLAATYHRQSGAAATLA